jgi:FAD/FMN-containing dehydrogenase
MTRPSPAALPSDPIAELARSMSGHLILPHDAEYDAVRSVFYGDVDRRPAIVARPATREDVVRVIGAARSTGLELAVRSGGHSVAGHSASEGGIVLDLRKLRSLEIDPESRTAWAGAGLTTGEYTVAAAAHGLATSFGDSGAVGIGGITLGGGIGYLARSHGLTVDDLLAAEVVTADGRILRVDADSHPDLFWAIRGGGGNFGVATRFRFRLHVLPTVVGGMMILPASPAIVSGFIAAAEDAPDALSAITMVMKAPPMPFVPEEVHGRLIVLALMAYSGNPADAEAALAPFRALAPPIVDEVREVPYPELFPPADEHRPLVAHHAMFMERVDVAVAETLLGELEEATAAMAVVQLRVLGGAMARVPVDATAFAHRKKRIMASIAAMYEDAAEGVEHRAWVDRMARALDQGDPDVYMSFLGNEGPERVRHAYPGATWNRLVGIKRRYDPENLFRMNQNIPPEG